MNFYGVKIYAAMRKIPVLFLKTTSVQSYVAPIGANMLVYKSTTVLAGFTDLNKKFPPMVDLVNSDVEITIHDYASMEELNAQLAAYGMKVELGEAEMEVMIVEEI